MLAWTLPIRAILVFGFGTFGFGLIAAAAVTPPSESSRRVSRWTSPSGSRAQFAEQPSPRCDLASRSKQGRAAGDRAAKRRHKTGIAFDPLQQPRQLLGVADRKIA